MKKLFINLLLIAALTLMCCGLCACSDAEDLGDIDRAAVRSAAIAYEEQGESQNEIMAEETAEELTAEPLKIYVHVCGAVKHADVYEISPDARIIDAVKLAGGMNCDASADYINLAGTVCDGMQIYIPTRKEVEEGYSGPTGSGTSGTAPSASGKVNINTAAESELKALNGIGEKRAKDIIAYRDAHGNFASIEDIKKVPGIKDAVFARISEFIEV